MQDGLRDIKPLVPVPLGPSWWEIALWVLAAALLIAGAVYMWRKRLAKPAAPVAQDPADVIALRALRALRLAPDATIEAVQTHYFALSEIVRTYVEARFGLNATDLTTEEILHLLHNQDELLAHAQNDLRAFLLASDAVKFAKRSPSQEDITNVFALAERFITTTRFVAQVPAQSA